MVDQPADDSAKAFENAIRAILTAFGIFTGVAIKSVLDEVRFSEAPTWLAIFDSFADSHLFIALATIGLLLRYIVGSSVHLNLCYVTAPRSTSWWMLYKDLGFLILFGLIAVFMIKAKSVTAFEVRASIFVGVGLLWSLLDWLIRDVFEWCGPEAGEKSLFSLPWIGIDIFQLVLTLLIWWKVDDVMTQSVLLFIVFSAALFGDMAVVLTGKKSA